MPRDPNQDLAIKAQLRATLGAMLAKTHGRNRHLVWARNSKLQQWTGLKRSTLDNHLRKLEDAGRILWLKSRAEVDRFFLESARFGPRFAQRPAAMPPDYERLIVLLAWLPPVLYPDAYGPLGLKTPPEEPPTGATQILGAPLPENGAQPSQDFGRPIEKEDSPEGETLVKSSPTTGGVRSPETTTEPDSSEVPQMGDDDGDVAVTEDREAKRAELVALVQANPNQAWARRLLERFDSATPPEPEPRRRSTWVESTAAGRERDPEPATKAPGGRQGDRGQSEAESIARKVAGGTMTPLAGGKALADAVGDSNLSTLETYRAGMSALAEGRVSLEEVLGVIAEEFRPSVDHPNWRLSKFFAQARRRVKKPAAGHTRQSGTGGGL